MTIDNIAEKILIIQPKVERIIKLIRRVIRSNDPHVTIGDELAENKALIIQIQMLNKATLSFTFLFDQNTFILMITDEEIEILNEDIDGTEEQINYLNAVLENPIQVDRYTSSNNLIKMKVHWCGVDEGGNKVIQNAFPHFKYTFKKLQKESKSYSPWISST